MTAILIIIMLGAPQATIEAVPFSSMEQCNTAKDKVDAVAQPLVLTVCAEN